MPILARQAVILIDWMKISPGHNNLPHSIKNSSVFVTSITVLPLSIHPSIINIITSSFYPIKQVHLLDQLLQATC
jgi:hypothetical protein